MTVAAAPTPALERIPLDLIDIGDNVRVNVAELEELAASIAEHGVLQPVKAVRAAGGRYLLVWGQRRVLASRQAGLTDIPAIVVDAAPEDAARPIEQLLENLHRADLNPIDRAAAMRAVVDAGVKQADLAKQLGIAPSTVANDLALLEAPERVRKALEQGEITPAHAKAMKGLAPKTQEQLLTEVVKQGYSAHDTERQVQEVKRRAEWERQSQEKSAATVKAREAAYAASIEAIAKGKTPKDGRLIVARDPYGRNAAATEKIAELLRGVGFTNVDTKGSVSSKPKGGTCDCVAWKVEERQVYSGSEYVTKVTVSPGCVKDAHLRAQTKLDEGARVRLYKLEEAVRAELAKQVVAWAIPDGQGNGVGLDRLLAEACLWNALEWRLGDWAKAIAGPKAKPWEVLRGLSDADLAKELAKAVVSEFRGKAGYKVGWDELAKDLHMAVAEQ